MTDLIAEYEEHLRSLRRSEATIENYIGVLRLMDRELPAGLIAATTRELRDWIFAEHRGRTTHSLYRSIAVQFGAWATDPADPRLSLNAAAMLPKVKRPKGRPRPITEEELGDILTRAAERYRLWFVLAAFAGLRCLEIAGIRREHVTEQEVYVACGKGAEERTIPTHPLIWSLVAAAPRGLLVRDRAGSPLTRQQVAHRGNYQLQVRLGHKAVSMHRLRHRFGTRTYEATKDIRAVQQLLGHANLATTQIYVDVTGDRKAAAVAGLPVAGLPTWAASAAAG